MKIFKCWFWRHKWIQDKSITTKSVCFGFAGCELPGSRVDMHCEKCGTKKSINLNMAMPNKYLRPEFDHLWNYDA